MGRVATDSVFFDHEGAECRDKYHRRCSGRWRDDVREIRRLYESTLHLGRFHPDRWTQPKLAEKFGVVNSLISDIVRRRIWTHV